LKGANVRGGKDYSNSEQFSLESLLSETQEAHVIHVFHVPGRCIETGLRETWDQAGPGWFQYSDDVVVDPETRLVTHVAGRPLERQRLYKVASVPDLSRAADGPTIGGWLSEPGTKRLPDFEAGIPMRALLLGYFADAVWHRIHRCMDADGDGKISVAELKQFDKDGDGVIDRSELMAALERIGFTASKDEFGFIKEVLKAAGDADGDSKLTRAEINESWEKKHRHEKSEMKHSQQSRGNSRSRSPRPYEQPVSGTK